MPDQRSEQLPQEVIEKKIEKRKRSAIYDTIAGIAGISLGVSLVLIFALRDGETNTTVILIGVAVFLVSARLIRPEQLMRLLPGGGR